MNLFLHKGSQAEKLFECPEFQRKWQVLFDLCPWATVFQNPLYLSVWYENYREKYEIAIIEQRDENENLSGLFLFCICRETKKICNAGDYHSEYQTWLALPENGNDFAEKLFNLLQKEFPEGRIQFLFLASGVPLEWLKGKWGEQSDLRKMPRPLVDLKDLSRIEESLRKKGNKTRMRQLKKIGNPEILKLKNKDDLEKIFDEIEDYSKLRLSALHNVKPEYDLNRKKFHLDLMQKTDFIHGTVFKIGDKIASTQICLKNRDEMLLCITSMSPFFARQSPSKIHLLLLEKEFSQQNINTLDLSPGEGYKDRFATHYENAYALTVFFDKKDFARYQKNRQTITFIRQNLEKFNIRKTRVFKVFDKIRHKLQKVRYRTIPRTLLKNLAKNIYDKRECRIYFMETESIDKNFQTDFFRQNSIADLLKYEPAEGWQFTASQFHQIVLERFAEGIKSFTKAEGQRLLHYGWLIENQEVSKIYEIDSEFRFPEGTAVLFDFYTHPLARGQGIYRKSLMEMLKQAGQIPGVKQVFIAVMADNQASRHVIEKLGFKYHSSLFRENICGFVRKY